MSGRRSMPELPAGMYGDGRWMPEDVVRALAAYREALLAGRPDQELGDLAWDAAVAARERAVEVVEVEGGAVKLRRRGLTFDDPLKAGQAAVLWFFGGELGGIARTHDERAARG